MLLDLRLALRTLRASPGFASVAIISIGLALGLSTTMFALADAVVHPYVPFSAPEQLYHVHALGGTKISGPRHYDRFLRLHDDDRFRDGIAVWSQRRVTVLSESGAHELDAAHVSANLFAVLGVRLIDGAGLRSTDGISADEFTAIVSERAWQQLTATRQTLPDAAITIDGASYTVVGVAPRGMNYPMGVDVWLPIPASSLLTASTMRAPGIVLRIDESRTEHGTQRDLDLIGAQQSNEFGLAEHPLYYRLDRVRPRFSRLRPVHRALGLAVGVVLLIACVNLSTLIVVRTLSRQRELAVRSALGASRGVLVGVVLSEALIIAAVGTLLGSVVAVWGIELARVSIPLSLEHLGLAEPRLSWRVFAFSTVVGCVAVIASSIGPALRAGNARPDAVLKDGSGTNTRRLRLRYNPLVIGAVGLSLTLLMGSGLLLRSSAEIRWFDFGYDHRGLSTAFLRAPPSAAQSDTGVAIFYETLLSRARAVDGIESAALFGGRTPERQTITIDDPGAGSRERFTPRYRVVSPAFLSTLGIRVIEGRDFATGDAELGGVAIVDQTMARELWPNAPAIERVVKLGRERSSAAWVRIIGVAQSAFLEAAPGEFPPPELYVVRTLGDDTREMRIAVRTRRESAAVTATLSQAMNHLAPNALVAARVEPWTRDLDAQAQRTNFLTMVLMTFAGFGLLLAIVGLYGVLAHAVQQRTREFAVRTALGATGRDLGRLVVHDSTVMVLAGIGLGAFVALWGVRRLRYVVFGLDTYDPIALLVAEAVLVAAAALACVVPLRSAIRADPVHVLRSF